MAKRYAFYPWLAPGNKISGGKVLSPRTPRSSSRAAALLRLGATTVGRSDTALGAFYHRLSSRAGGSKNVKATAPRAEMAQRDRLNGNVGSALLLQSAKRLAAWH